MKVTNLLHQPSVLDRDPVNEWCYRALVRQWQPRIADRFESGTREMMRVPPGARCTGRHSQGR